MQTCCDACEVPGGGGARLDHDAARGAHTAARGVRLAVEALRIVQELFHHAEIACVAAHPRIQCCGPSFLLPLAVDERCMQPANSRHMLIWQCEVVSGRLHFPYAGVVSRCKVLCHQDSSNLKAVTFLHVKTNRLKPSFMCSVKTRGLTKALGASHVREPMAHARGHLIWLMCASAPTQALVLAGYMCILMTQQSWPPADFSLCLRCEQRVELPLKVSSTTCLLRWVTVQRPSSSTFWHLQISQELPKVTGTPGSAPGETDQARSR